MKVAISSNFNDKYFFFSPIVAFCWGKLGVLVDYIFPENELYLGEKFRLVTYNSIIGSSKGFGQPMGLVFKTFKSPSHKEITYSQCARLFNGIENSDHLLMTSDVDMAVFKLPPYEEGMFTIWGVDLVPPKQFPMCYATNKSHEWWKVFNKGRDMQKCLDDMLAYIECESFSGNYWAKDQEELYNYLNYSSVSAYPRARPGTQFASHRVDRDDINWRSYLGPDLIDAHLWRPGYTEENFANIMELLTTQYPNDDFQWLIDYRQNYISLL